MFDEKARIATLIFIATLLPAVVNSSVVAGRSFIKRATEAEICGAADYYICSDRKTCCPNDFLCQDDGCVTPSDTDVVITVTVKSKHKPTLGIGAIAGIAGGGLIFLIAAGLAIFLCIRKRKIGKEVLKAYEDPNRNMYDQVVVEGKRISVVPIGNTGTSVQQHRQKETQLSPPSEAEEFQETAGRQDVAVGPQVQYPQYQQPQPYQSYQQQPQQPYYNQDQEQILQSTNYNGDQLPPGAELATHQPYSPTPTEPIPDSLRVGSPVSPIRADSMGLIPLIADAADGGQHPYQFSPLPTNMVRHQSTPLPPPPHHTTEGIPQSSTSLPTMPIHSVSPPPQTPTSYSPVYYEAPSPPSRETSPEGYSQTQQPGLRRKPTPQSDYSSYQQYPELASPVPSVQHNRYSMHPGGLDHRRTGDYANWDKM